MHDAKPLKLSEQQLPTTSERNAALLAVFDHPFYHGVSSERRLDWFHEQNIELPEWWKNGTIESIENLDALEVETRKQITTIDEPAKSPS